VAAREALMEGRGFVVQSGVSFLSQNADYFAIGRVLGAGQLGLYSMGYRLGELPASAIADPAAQVTFPGFARMRHRGEDVVPSFLAVLRFVALLACPLGALLSACAEPFIRTLFDEKWIGVIGPLAVFGIWGAVRPVQTSIGWFLNSVGEAAIMGTVAAAFLLLLIPGTLLAADLAGLTAVAWVMLAQMLASLVVLATLAARRGNLPVRRLWDAVGAVVLACALCWPAARFVAEATDSAAPAASLALSMAAGLATYLAATAVFNPGALTTAVGQGRRILSRAAEGDEEPVPTPVP
jgi:O-antigen/teichoic acid export membrane protein